MVRLIGVSVRQGVRPDHPTTRRTEMPKVSFITVCYRTPHLIRVLLKGIEEAKFSFPFEYFLVDNGQDETVKMVRERFPWVTVIEPGANIGFGRANNLALAQAKGEYVMLVNPDLTIFPGEMEKLLAFADAAPDSGIIGPLVENPNGTRQESCTRFPHALMPFYSRTILGRTPWGRKALDRYLMRDVPHDQPHDTDTVYGAAMLIRRPVIERIGMFDDRFFMYYEDVDLCRRVWQSGHRVTYAPVARFVHYHQRESRIRTPWEVFTNRTARIHIASGVKYFLKYRRQAQTDQTPTPAVPTATPSA
jgi:GT2 family glycosyltransferase